MFNSNLMLNNSSVPYWLCACFPLLQHSYASPSCGATRCCLTCSGEVSWFPWFHKSLKKIFAKAFHPCHKQVSQGLSHGSRNDPEIFPLQEFMAGAEICELCGKKLPAWLLSLAPLQGAGEAQALPPAAPCGSTSMSLAGEEDWEETPAHPWSRGSGQAPWSCQWLCNAFGWCCVLKYCCCLGWI